MSAKVTPPFDGLSPELVLDAVERSFGLRLNGIITPYSSYINRVYGLESEAGERYVVKFYRPGRWSAAAIEEEHRFVIECMEQELPVVPPLVGTNGRTLQEVGPGGHAEELGTGGQTPQDVVTGGYAEEAVFRFALFDSKGGRLFDAEGDESWRRIGALIGRLHLVGRLAEAPSRVVYTPAHATRDNIDELLQSEVVHPDCAEELFAIAGRVVDRIEPLFDGLRLQRIHGDCHRGNILDRDRELMLIDFDDMAMGPPIQDLWLLLPDYAAESAGELGSLIEGYEQFGSFDHGAISLIEPLRFMRMIHYLAWTSRQRHDHRFRNLFPEWGGRSFWVKEIEDLRVQSEVIGVGTT